MRYPTSLDKIVSRKLLPLDHHRRANSPRSPEKGSTAPDQTGPTRSAWVEAKALRVADEVRYIQRRAAERSGRIVTIGPLLLFSTESGDAWILDPGDHLATRIAEGGNPRPVHLEETETSFAVGWQGRYDITDAAFVFTNTESGDVTTILGYPTRQIADQIADNFG